MAIGAELLIGFSGKGKIDEIAASLGLSVDFDSGDVTPDESYNQISTNIKGAWREAIGELGLEIIGADRWGYPIARTPTGNRVMTPWDLRLYYDPDEMGDEPEHAIFGISLITRYKPTFLDWAKEHGGSGDVITLNIDTMVKIQVARRHIEKVLPIFAVADIHIKELHY